MRRQTDYRHRADGEKFDGAEKFLGGGRGGSFLRVLRIKSRRKAGDKRTVNVDFPANFVTKPLAGQKGVFEVEVVEVKEKALPAIDDAFAKKYEAENLAKLREGVERGFGE